MRLSSNIQRPVNCKDVAHSTDGDGGTGNPEYESHGMQAGFSETHGFVQSVNRKRSINVMNFISCSPHIFDGRKQNFLKDNGAIEINTQDAEAGWWFGRYDKEQKLYRTEEVALEE